ncbi:EMBRYO DEFECTIVE 2788 [Hibiscus trionum]|uniref:EMBRYO DEFECTIVE 2788 n=1 Tax=Hibiscus trionum TaxID=183268 RepID=A0A9W7HHR5_HIBTR|nr:EMBRYO DEFECTIVE 2788 [Hibiscus trionum]
MASDNGTESEFEGEQEEGVSKTTVIESSSFEAKLDELLHKIKSIEIKLFSNATKEFVKLLKTDAGAELLRLYVQTSPSLSELLEAWKLRQGKPGTSYALSLISAILCHPQGRRYNDKLGVSRALDKFARLIVDEKLEDVYKELSSKDGKRQNAALLLMGSVVRRGSGLASEVAKKFDFKLQGFSKLSEYKKRKQIDKKKHSTRKSFVGFAMSFLEMGKPGLLRWVLQQRDMYSGVLRGLGNDDDETVMYILATLRDRVLTEESLVPPGLRSVLFGSVTLEQLVNISGRENGGVAAELAYSVLLMVCTDPSNGLMPALDRKPNPLKGNPTRLLGVMKKLRATEVSYHKDLLLATLRGRPTLGAAYMNEFPYSVEDHASPIWFSSVSLAASLISSVAVGNPFGFLDAMSHDPPSFDSADVQDILSCICPRPLGRSVVTKGLLHSDFLVKHGALRLLLEALKLLDSFMGSLNRISGVSNQLMGKWVSLKQDIQNEVRTLLPDTQVLLTLLSSLGAHDRTPKSSLKRKPGLEKNSEKSSLKKLKAAVLNEDSDIIVGGISSVPDISMPEDHDMVADVHMTDELGTEREFLNVISEIWGLYPKSNPLVELKDVEMYFYSKLTDTLTIYLRTVPTVLEGSFDFFMNLLNSSALPIDLQCSLLSFLIEYIGCSPGNGKSNRTPLLMYRHLQTFINLLTLSPNSEIKNQAYILARAAMLSTGAFDRDLCEIDAWFLFLPGYSRTKSPIEVQTVEVLKSLSGVVISFLGDAISTIGNNLFKRWDIVRQHISCLEGFKGISPKFSPLTVCALDKCLRLLNSSSGTFSLSEKSMISLYVCNTLKYLLQTQVDARLLSDLIQSALSKGLGDRYSMVYDSGDFLCEWRPLKSLLYFSQNALYQHPQDFLSIDKTAIVDDSSFAKTLGEVKNVIRDEDCGELTGIVKAFYSAMLCATPEDLLMNFPSVMTISVKLGVAIPLLSSIIFSEQNFLVGLSNLWPEVFFPGLELALVTIHKKGSGDAEGMPSNIDFDTIESAATAFSLLLKQVPFHVLFSAVIHIDAFYLSEHSKMQDLLLTKRSEWTGGYVISCLRLVLFWFYRVRFFYRNKQLTEQEQLSDTCLILVKNMFSQLLTLEPEFECSMDSEVLLSAETLREVAETILCHPEVMSSLNCPMRWNKEVSQMTTGLVGNGLDTFLSLSRQRLHKLDHQILDLLTATLDYYLSVSKSHYSVIEDGEKRTFQRAFSSLVQRLFIVVRDRFDLCIASGDSQPLLSSFCALHALIQSISPFELLELGHWMFSRIDVNELTVENFHVLAALCVGFSIVGGAFEVLSAYLQQPLIKRVPYDFLWEVEEKTFDVNLLEDIYVKVCKLACNFKLDFTDSCLLRSVSAVYRQENMHHGEFHPSSVAMSRVIISTPVEMVSHCICRTSIVKAKLLHLLIEMSPLHLSVFGKLFLSILNKKFLPNGILMKEVSSCALSDQDQDHMMLLPSALSLLNSSFVKFEKQFYHHFKIIPSFYSKMLLNGFMHWKSFVSRDIFLEDYSDSLPSSAEELFNLVDGSLLGKSIHMLRYHFFLSGDSVKLKKRLELFNSVFPSSVTQEELIDCDATEMDFSSVNKSMNHINKVIAKISFCRMMLFPEDDKVLFMAKEADEGLKETSLILGSNKVDSSRMHFMNALVGAWQWIVKKLPILPAYSTSILASNGDCVCLYRCLEVFILRNIFQLTRKMHDYLFQLQSIPFVEQLMRSTLLHRFEDSNTLRILRSILLLLSEGKFSRVLCLQMLLGHSQFGSMIHSISKPSVSEIGTFFKPMSSILRLLVTHHIHSYMIDGKDDQEAAEMCKKQLEILKLLRILLSGANQSGFDSGNDNGINLKELHSLLLSSYGATLGEIDLEIYSLMNVIESIHSPGSEYITEMDYLWGTSATKVKKEQMLKHGASTDIMTDTEAVQEGLKIKYRENLPVDPKVCAATVLHFPYDRTASEEHLSLSKFRTDNLMDMIEPCSPGAGKILLYDPVFIMHFSIHSFSAGYIEPVEFTGLGLLAVAFVSTSSPDLGLRKLAYEVLSRFKISLEGYKKKKDVMRLHLLLMYIQNGIEEPWQRIPSVIALFAAETSLILLDTLHEHYSTLNKLLMDSSRVNMKQIPLFHDFFHSNAVNYRAQRLWILRLVYAGLNLEDDAWLYIRSSILETVMSFYVSPLSDAETKKIILQILKKSVQLHKTAHYLVEHCSLFPWLSSILSTYSRVLLGDEKKCFSTELAVVIEIVRVVISSNDIAEWLQSCALEQLMELTSHLYKLLVGGKKLINEYTAFVDPTLQIIISTLKMSRSRQMYQPHFTLSHEVLFEIYLAVNEGDIGRCSGNAKCALEAILLSGPPVDIFCMNREKLSSFLMWATSTALKSKSRKVFQWQECGLHVPIVSREASREESFASKLLRWLAASIIHGKLSWNSNISTAKFSDRSNSKNLQSLLEYVAKDDKEGNECSSDLEEMLAAQVFYLQQSLGINCSVLPSVVSALCLLLLSDDSKFTGSDFMHDLRTSMVTLCSKIRCPPELNPSWRWSFEQPWEEDSAQLTDLERMDEVHACQSLLLTLSNVLRRKSADFQGLSLQDVDESGVFEWETSILEPQ